jgi:transposase-like protein
MYSYEDRMRAVRLYLKLGKRVGATIRQLGYPTKNSLKSWHLEYERCHDLRIGYVRSRPIYSAQQKKVAVDHYLDHDRCAAATLRALGVSESRDARRLDRRAASRNWKTHCRQSNWQHSEIAGGEAGGGHRAVHQRGKRAPACPENRREQADALQLEEPATRS